MNKFFGILGSLLLGFFFNKKYSTVLCLQNNNEIRSTGGFITKVVLVQSSFLKLKFKFLNVFEDFPKSDVLMPKSFGKSLGYSKDMNMHFRDSNMNLDDRKNFLNMQRLFKLNFGFEVSEFILINYTMIEKLFDIYGPIKFNDMIWDSTNLFRRLTQSTSDIDRHSLKDLKNRKNVLQKLLKLLMLRVIVKFYKLFDLFILLKKSISDKSLQLLSIDSVLPEGPIYRENNLIGLKNNRYISRKVELMTEIKPTEIVRTYVFSWYHPAEDNWPLSGLYNAIFEFKPQDDFEIISSMSVPQKWYKESKFNIRLEPKESQSIIIKTSLAINEIPNLYTLFYNKQSGTYDRFTEIISCPKNYNINDGLDYVYTHRCDPLSDEKKEIIITRNDYPPRVIKHEVINKKEILINFNEPVSLSNTFNVELSRIKDLKRYKVDYRMLDDRTGLLIIPKSWDPVEGDFFEVSIEGVRNINGISISPVKRILTVVYRSKYFIS